jgi:hypothetical protein
MKVRELFETTKDLKEYSSLLGDLAFFTSLNTSMIQQDANDNDSKEELKLMQQQFRKPILNGMTFHEVYDKPQVYNNPKVIPVLLKYEYDMINYIEPRIKKFVKQDKQQKYLNRLDSVKSKYKEQIKYLS